MLVLFKFILPLFLLNRVQSTVNNVCKNYISYFFIENSSLCYYNIDVDSDMPTIIRNHFGEFEMHKITTEDGYILTAFRMPVKKPKGVVVLQHPLTTDSIVFVGQSDSSLARNGYEVWMANNRGTPTSQEHLTLSTNSPKYWNFSFHEIALYDYPAILNYINVHTNRSDLIYVGHSMGSTAALVFASLKPVEAKRLVKVFINLAPSSMMKHSNSPMILVALLLRFVEKLPEHLAIGPVNSFITRVKMLRTGNSFLLSNPLKKIFIYIISFFFGWTPQNSDPEYVNSLIKHNFLVHSSKIWLHYAQLLTHGAFQMYDYGPEGNYRMYNARTPPEYPLENIEVPVHLVCAQNDSTMLPKDCETLYNRFQTQAKVYGWHLIKDFNHIDYFYGKRRAEVFSYLLDFMERNVVNTMTY